MSPCNPNFGKAGTIALMAAATAIAFAPDSASAFGLGRMGGFGLGRMGGHGSHSVHATRETHTTRMASSGKTSSDKADKTGKTDKSLSDRTSSDKDHDWHISYTGTGVLPPQLLLSDQVVPINAPQLDILSTPTKLPLSDAEIRSDYQQFLRTPIWSAPAKVPLFDGDARAAGGLFGGGPPTETEEEPTLGPVETSTTPTNLRPTEQVQ